MREVQTDDLGLLAVAKGISLLSDLNRGDVVLYEKFAQGRFRVVAQAQPHSVPPIPYSLFGGARGAFERITRRNRRLTW